MCTRSRKRLPCWEQALHVESQPLGASQVRQLPFPPQGAAVSPYQHCAQLPARFVCPLLVIVNFPRTGNFCLSQVELWLWGTPEKPRHRSRARCCRLLWPFLSPIFVFRLLLRYFIMKFWSFCYNFGVLAVICLSALLCKRFTWKFMYSHKLSIHSALSRARLGLPATSEQYRERLSWLTCHKLSINSTTYVPFFLPFTTCFP